MDQMDVLVNKRNFTSILRPSYPISGVLVSGRS